MGQPVRDGTILKALDEPTDRHLEVPFLSDGYLL